MEPGQYLDGEGDRREGSCYRRGALESWKADGFGDGFGRELDAWQWNDWREGDHGSIEWSGVWDGAWAILRQKRGQTGRELLWEWSIRELEGLGLWGPVW